MPQTQIFTQEQALDIVAELDEVENKKTDEFRIYYGIDKCGNKVQVIFTPTDSTLVTIL